MADLQTIAGLGACGTANSVFFGNKVGCLKALSNLRSGGFKRKTASYSKTTTFDDAFIQLEIQKNNLIVLPENTVFTQGGGENSRNTDEIGVNEANVKGLVEFTVKLKGTQHFFKQIHKLNSFDEWEFIVIDDKDTMLLVETLTEFKGLQVGLIDDEAQKFGVIGGESGSKSFYFQLINRAELDEDLIEFYADNHGIKFRDYSGINAGVINIIGAGAGTSINIDAFLIDNKTPLALANGDLKAIVNGDDVAVSAVASGTSAEKYVLTLASAVSTSDTLVIQTDDSTNNTLAINKGGEIYSAISEEVAVA